MSLYSAYYNFFLRPNNFFADYFQKEYKKLIAGRKILGVLCRGTDYIKTKPKNHPVQPMIQQVISDVSNVINDYDGVYLATEEEGIFQSFLKAFPGKILQNKRHYYDNYYSMNKEITIYNYRLNIENEDFIRSLEYWSSLFLLSKCDSLIAGECGGSRAAFYLNGGKYQHCYIYDLGTY